VTLCDVRRRHLRQFSETVKWSTLHPVVPSQSSTTEMLEISTAVHSFRASQSLYALDVWRLVDLIGTGCGYFRNVEEDDLKDPPKLIGRCVRSFSTSYQSNECKEKYWDAKRNYCYNCF
jgi:hypothetical protein